MEPKTIKVAGISGGVAVVFVYTAILLSGWFTCSSGWEWTNNPYSPFEHYCEDRDMKADCYKLSGINSNGISTRCYKADVSEEIIIEADIHVGPGQINQAVEKSPKFDGKRVSVENSWIEYGDYLTFCQYYNEVTLEKWDIE